MFQKNDLNNKKDSSIDLLKKIIRKVVESKDEQAIKLQKTHSHIEDKSVKR